MDDPNMEAARLIATALRPAPPLPASLQRSRRESGVPEIPRDSIEPSMVAKAQVSATVAASVTWRLRFSGLLQSC